MAVLVHALVWLALLVPLLASPRPQNDTFLHSAAPRGRLLALANARSQPAAADPPLGWFGYATGAPVAEVGLPPREAFKEVVLCVSFPRTGSTWLYQLVEEQSGIESCGVYDESRHRNFFGGRTIEDVYGVFRTRNSRRLGPQDNCVTKTHFPYLTVADDGNVRPSRLIRLVRNPVDSVMSMWDYERKNRFVKRSSFQVGSGGKLPSVQEIAGRYHQWMTFWETFMSDLAAAHADSPSTFPYIPTLTVRYEDLCSDAEATLRTVLEVAGLPPRTDGRAPVIEADCDKYFGKNLAHITPQEFEYVVNLTRPSIDAFGYGELVDAQRAKRREMSADMAVPWQVPPDGPHRMCSMRCEDAVQCDAWDPLAFTGPSWKGGVTPGTAGQDRATAHLERLRAFTERAGVRNRKRQERGQE